MQAPRSWFSIPGLRGLRPAGRPGQTAPPPGHRPTAPRSWRRVSLRLPRVRLPALGPRALGGLVACLLVLAPGILAAELTVWGYDARLAEDARVRATAGLDAAAGLVDAERTRALNN